MKKKFGIAILALTLATSLVACKPSARPTNKPNNNRPPVQEEQIEVQKGDFKFVGKTTIKDVEYSCELHCYESTKTFNLYVIDQNKVYSGTYSFTDGVGYKMNFDNSVVSSIWNDETKSHEVTYKIRLGRLGSGNVTVSLKDEDFVLKQDSAFDKFTENAQFHFDDTINGFHIVLDLNLAKDGTYSTTTNNEAAAVYGGTYTFENNILTLTEVKDGQPTGKVYKSTYDPVTSTYSIPGSIYVFGNAMTVNYTYCTRRLGSLTGSTDVMGGPGYIDLKILDDQNALFDFTWKEGGNQFDTIFDKKATYIVRGRDYIFTVGDDVFTTTYDNLTKEYTLDFTLRGQSTFDFKLKGSLPGFNLTGKGGEGMMASTFSVDFLGLNENNEQKVVIRTITAAPSMNGSYQEDGTYKPSFMDKMGILKSNEDGSFAIVVGDKTYNLEFDDENGIYSFDYEISGGEGTIQATLSTSIWK